MLKKTVSKAIATKIVEAKKTEVEKAIEAMDKIVRGTCPAARKRTLQLLRSSKIENVAKGLDRAGRALAKQERLNAE